MRMVRALVVGALLWAALPWPATSQEDMDQSRRNAIVRAIEKAAPAVVSVNVVELEAESVFDPFTRDFRDLFFYSPPAYRLRERQINSVGSGFLFDERGYVLTNYHVVEGAQSVASVTLPDGRALDAELAGFDVRTDLAVLRVKGTGLPHVSLGDSDDLLIGEWVIAIGNPFGTVMRDPQPSVSVGVVSANHRRLSPSIGEGERLYQRMIQTDAAINPGNSGGPLVNARGEAIGVNTMILSKTGGSIGLGFALPINRARRVADEIIRYGRRRDPWPGFFISELRQGQDTVCAVDRIRDDCPAYKAGLRPGDVITAVNGEPIISCYDVDFAMWDLFVGDTATIEVRRGGRQETIRFPIAELQR